MISMNWVKDYIDIKDEKMEQVVDANVISERGEEK